MYEEQWATSLFGLVFCSVQISDWAKVKPKSEVDFFCLDSVRTSDWDQNSGVRLVFGPSERLIQKVKSPNVYCLSYSLFTPPTRTRQDSFVLSVSAVWTQLQTRQDSFVLSRPSFQFATVQSLNILRITEQLEIGNWSSQDKTVLFCACRRCEQAVTHGYDRNEGVVLSRWCSLPVGQVASDALQQVITVDSHVLLLATKSSSSSSSPSL